MKARLRLACLALMSIFVVSCGSNSNPTAPVDPVDYVLSGSADSTETPFSVDDELRLFVNAQSVGSSTGGVVRFRARPGDTLLVQALDTCQGLYGVSALWLHRSGVPSRQITAGVATCSVSSVPCIAAVDCGAPDRVFFQTYHSLP